MSQPRPGLIRRTLVGTWRALDFTRRFILTVLFLVLVAMFLAAAFAPGPKLTERTALLIDPAGLIVEEYTLSPSDRLVAQLTGDDIPEVRLRDLLRVLDAAAGDDRIERVVLRLDKLIGGGVASLREVGAAVDRVRASGKEVIAYGNAYSQGAYYIAARASEVHLDPGGMLLLEGFGRYRFYFAEAFEKLGIEARVFRVGEYKSAGEPYFRSDASEEAREADLYWMGDLWQRYLADVGAMRELAPQALQAAIDDLPARLAASGGDLARLALDMGLVDQLTPWHQIERELVSQGVANDDGDSFRQIDIDTYLAVLDREQGPRAPARPIAVVVAQGPIVYGDPGLGVVGGDVVSGLLRKAREDDDVRAVVLRIDSPGGAVFPSEQIRREVELLRQAGKPVVASMGDVAASGGYWIAMDADRIVADPTTITGSIGVFALWVNAAEAVAKLGLNSDGVATTWLPGAVDPMRPYDPRLGELLQTSVDHTYRDFVGRVAQARGASGESIETVARGRVWSGSQALDRSLVDELGGLAEAIGHARRLADLGDDAGFAYIDRELSSFDRFLDGVGKSSALRAAVDRKLFLPGSWLPAQTRDELRQVRELLNRRDGRDWGLYAHCRCEL